ncbi:MAG: 4Fe-4S binding protein [Treponema sp.]|nr:4Fe-4S binding protein [Treponema sp.]
MVAFGFCNSQVQNFLKGKLYTGKWKKFCSPGLNCYSCPAATYSCPIGALQAVGGSSKFSFSFYIVGIILAFGVIFGRAVCGFLCPFGLMQEIVNLIPSPKLKIPRWMKYIKFAVLLIFVLILPVADTNYSGVGDPAFCKYICPAGTLEGGLPLAATHPEIRSSLGSLFFLKSLILISVLILCVFCYRFFCKALCPLGAIYGLLNKISFYRLHLNESTCIHCGKCARACKMDVNPLKSPNSIECIRCGSCIEVCPTKSLHAGI